METLSWHTKLDFLVRTTDINMSGLRIMGNDDIKVDRGRHEVNMGCDVGRKVVRLAGCRIY